MALALHHEVAGRVIRRQLREVSASYWHFAAHDAGIEPRVEVHSFTRLPLWRSPLHRTLLRRLFDCCARGCLYRFPRFRDVRQEPDHDVWSARVAQERVIESSDPQTRVDVEFSQRAGRGFTVNVVSSSSSATPRTS